jgi:hypothetical protein
MILKAHEAKYIRVRHDRTRMIRKPSSPFATYLIGKREESPAVVVSTVRDTDTTGEFLINVDRQSRLGNQQTLYDHIWTV